MSNNIPVENWLARGYNIAPTSLSMCYFAETIRGHPQNSASF
jgi:hypothetical protein